MGNLSTAQLNAIVEGQPIKQRFWMRVPVSPDHSSFYDVQFEEGVHRYNEGLTPFARVIKAGKRKHRVWNPHPNVSMQATALRYRFEVSNEDGFFNTGADTIFYYGGFYSCEPQECFVVHKVYVWEPVAESWDEITHMNFVGKILDIDYQDGARPDKVYPPTPALNVPEASPETAVITCEQYGVWSALNRVFQRDDADISMVDDPSGAGKYYLDRV